MTTVKRYTKPYQYQIEVIERCRAFLRVYGYAALCPVDMGLGKTLMSLYVALEEHYTQIIIVCPKTLMNQWKKEISTHTNIEFTVMMWDSQKSKTEKWKRAFCAWLCFSPRIAIVNVEAWQTKNKNLEKLFDDMNEDVRKTVVIFDESTKIKAVTAGRTQRIVQEFPKVWNRMILSGAPVTNSILDLFTQYEFLKNNFWNIKNYENINLKHAFYKFRYRYSILEEEYHAKDKTHIAVVGYRQLDDLKRRIEHCTIQLKKEDCIDLPEKTEQYVVLDMSAEMREFYDSFCTSLIAQLDDDSLSVTKAIQKFTRLRQICGGFFPTDGDKKIRRFLDNVKIETIYDMTEDTGEKIIIVGSYHEEIDIIKEKLVAGYSERSVVCYTGRQTTDERAENLERFKSNDETRFLIINPQTGAFGLNLQFARIMFFYSITTSQEQFVQLKDRIYRNGQKNECLYKYFSYRNTIDEQLKADRDQGVEMSLKFFSKEEIKQYLIEKRTKK
jgi:SNF2 family DNA or RNA helicase